MTGGAVPRSLVRNGSRAPEFAVSRSSGTLIEPPMWRYLGQLPQDGNVARVAGLYRVHGGSFVPHAAPSSFDLGDIL